VSSAEMHNSSLRTESMKEQTSRCGELARTGVYSARVINPRRACAARVTVVAYVCVCVR
jgi:hypothetical protein